jgi:hypothetical protein
MQMTRQLPAYSAQAESLKRFFNMYFVAHDIMSRTGRTQCEGQGDNEVPSHVWLENDDLDEVRVLLRWHSHNMPLTFAYTDRQYYWLFSPIDVTYQPDIISYSEEIQGNETHKHYW